jgi:hypothetical protein
MPGHLINFIKSEKSIFTQEGINTDFILENILFLENEIKNEHTSIEKEIIKKIEALKTKTQKLKEEISIIYLSLEDCKKNYVYLQKNDPKNLSLKRITDIEKNFKLKLKLKKEEINTLEKEIIKIKKNQKCTQKITQLRSNSFLLSVLEKKSRNLKF